MVHEFREEYDARRYLMASIPTWATSSCKDQVPPTVKATRQKEKGTTDNIGTSCRAYGYIRPSRTDKSCRRWNATVCGSELHHEAKQGYKLDAFCMVHHRTLPCQRSVEVPVCEVYNAESNDRLSSTSVRQRDWPCYNSPPSGGGNVEKQLKALDSYFTKLQLDSDYQLCSRISESGSKTVPTKLEDKLDPSLFGSNIEANDPINNYKSKARLDSLDDYFDKLNVKSSTSSTRNEEAAEEKPTGIAYSATEEYNEKKDVIAKEKSYANLENMINKNETMLLDEKNIEDQQIDDGASGFYLINLLAAINIAVFLFEIASPIRNSDIENLTLPLFYGAKINKLILLGEWWRLLTPMFLHSGFLHVALSCWMLISFGPQVSRGYGQLTFFLIYLLGGVCGNLTSFIHTPELTVCGTGPDFALMGAWLAYQIQNKQVSAKDVSESMFQKAVIATALSFMLSYFGRIDDWTHLGATISGLAFGYIACPSLELDDTSSKNGQKQGIALVQRQADPRKSLAIFTLCILLLTSLVLVYGTQLQMFDLDSFL
ncbi:RHOMBOID-like protein 9, chloroplastic isoform X1 [Typha latifolia]|uniref:RHOMBOID-like protein 9, chloroplastic isoform X1 n=2 Tax=Typha latifolia TaxID=4733 RepID=UPI003C2C1883